MLLHVLRIKSTCCVSFGRSSFSGSFDGRIPVSSLSLKITGSWDILNVDSTIHSETTVVILFFVCILNTVFFSSSESSAWFLDWSFFVYSLTY